MFKHHLISTIRYLISNRKTVGLNTLGLSLGIAVFFILWLYIDFEKSYDAFLPGSENIYRVQFNRYQNGESLSKQAMSVYAIGPLMKDHISEVENYARGGYEKCLVVKDENIFNEQEVLWADSTLLDVLPLEIVAGSKYKALDLPYTSVLSQSLAKKLFGNQDPIGETFTMNGRLHFTVTAVYKDIPENSHMNYKLFLALVTGHDAKQWPNNHGWGNRSRSWGGSGWLYTYVKLKKGSDVKKVEAQIAQLVQEHLPARFRDQGLMYEFLLQPVKSIHLGSQLGSELKPGGSQRNVNFISLAGILVLLMAWMNFANIANAEAWRNMKETGIKKIIGANKLAIALQVILRSLIQNVLAAIIAMSLILCTVHFFDDLTGKPLSVYLDGNPGMWLNIPIVVILGSLLTGIAPAIVFTNYKPIIAVASSIGSNKKTIPFRMLFVQFQLLIAFVMVSGIIIMYKQVKLMQNQNLGYETEQVIIIEGPAGLNYNPTKPQKFEQLKNRLEQYSTIKGLTAMRWGLGDQMLANQIVDHVNGEKINSVYLHLNFVDEEYVNVLGLDVVGANFSHFYSQNQIHEARNNPNRYKVLINESAVHALGFESENDAIGKFIKNGRSNNTFQIIGVVNDFHQESLHSEIKPSIYRHAHPPTFGYYACKISGENMQETVALIRKKWNEVYIKEPFRFHFLDTYINNLYKSEMQLSKLFSIFAVVALMVCCFGLLGLMLISTKKNIKQIGVRKVNGASSFSIVKHLTINYLTWTIIACMVGVPICIFIMRKWLESYVYKTEISWWIFVLASTVTVGFSLLTVSFQSYKAATRNPVEALRYE